MSLAKQICRYWDFAMACLVGCFRRFAAIHVVAGGIYVSAIRYSLIISLGMSRASKASIVEYICLVQYIYSDHKKTTWEEKISALLIPRVFCSDLLVGILL